jgi:hypothetical protein
LPLWRTARNLTGAVTIRDGELRAGREHLFPIIQILFKLDRLQFESNERHIRVDLAQKRRFISNDSFKPVC